MVGLSGNGPARIQNRPLMSPTRTFLKNSTQIFWGVKGLIVTRSVVSWFPLGVRWFSRGGCILVPFLQFIFQFVTKKKKKIKHYTLIWTYTTTITNYLCRVCFIIIIIISPTVIHVWMSKEGYKFFVIWLWPRVIS